MMIYWRHHDTVRSNQGAIKVLSNDFCPGHQVRVTEACKVAGELLDATQERVVGDIRIHINQP